MTRKQKLKLSLANDVLQRTLMFQDIFLFETRPGDEKDDKNSLQRFGVLHLLQREILEGSVADLNKSLKADLNKGVAEINKS